MKTATIYIYYLSSASIINSSIADPSDNMAPNEKVPFLPILFNILFIFELKATEVIYNVRGIIATYIGVLYYNSSDVEYFNTRTK